jgi:hypothetical protein
VYGFILVGALKRAVIMQRKSGEKKWNPIKWRAKIGILMEDF